MTSRSNPEKRKLPDEDATGQLPSTQKKLAISLKPQPPKSKSIPAVGVPATSAAQNQSTSAVTFQAKSKESVKTVFDSDSDSDDAEEMPPECKMRMRNVGRDTPTSAGPNSFRKGKQGFVDGRKVAERKLQEMISKVADK